MKLDSEKLSASDLDLEHGLDQSQNQPSVVAERVAAVAAAGVVVVVEAAVGAVKAAAVVGAARSAAAAIVAAVGVWVVVGWVFVVKLPYPA